MKSNDMQGTSSQNDFTYLNTPSFTGYDSYPTNTFPDWNQTTTTVYSTYSSTEKLCPYRKRTHAMMTGRDGQEYQCDDLDEAEYFEEEFLPCMMHNCMKYIDGQCGR